MLLSDLSDLKRSEDSLSQMFCSLPSIRGHLHCRSPLPATTLPISFLSAPFTRVHR